jgi:hypothetical protein
MSNVGGRREGAGRKRGVPNKATRDLKELAQLYTTEAVAALAEIINSTEAPAKARVDAAVALLDRGHGRPKQQVEAEINQAVNVTIRRFTPPPDGAAE